MVHDWKTLILDSFKKIYYVSAIEIPLNNRYQKGISSPSGDEPSLMTVIDSSVVGDLILLTEKGRVFRIPIRNLWDFKDDSKEKEPIYLEEFCPDLLSDGDYPCSMFFVEEKFYLSKETYLMIVTEKARVKKMNIRDLTEIGFGKGKRAVVFANSNDRVSCSCLARDGDLLLLASSSGNLCKFKVNDFSSSSFLSSGVISMNLSDTNSFLSTCASCKENDLIFIGTFSSKGKLTPSGDFKLNNRGRRKGSTSIQLNQPDWMKFIFPCREDDHIICLNSNNQLLRFDIKDLPVQKKYSSGVRLMSGSKSLVSVLPVRFKN